MKPLFLITLLVFFSLTSKAAQGDKAPPQASDAGKSEAEEVDVQKIKERYWNQADEPSIGVVQSRLYSNRHRVEFGISGGSISGDPFLAIQEVGGSIGFHFTEFFSVHAVGWKASVNPSSALTTLQDQTGATANTNSPQSYFGGEARESVLYGKLSVLGQAILYFDFYVAAGGGSISTESGSSILLSGGVGQQIHVSQLLAINLDFRLVRYNETIIGKGTDLGRNLGQRTNLSSMASLGLSLSL